MIASTAPLALLLALAAAPPDAASEYVSPARARLKADVAYLADDAREGRGVGTAGIDAAADYIASAFKDAGLKPAPGADGYFQPFSIRGAPRLGPDQTLVVSLGEKALPARLHRDWTPLTVGREGTVSAAPLVFAGYGITAHDEALKLDYDDYDGLDVKGKVVLIIRREPQANKADSPFAGRENTRYATFGHKATNAAKHGAAAVLLINQPTARRDELIAFDEAAGGGVAIPFAMVTRAYADRLLEAAGEPSVEDLEKQIDEDLKPRSRALKGAKVDVTVTIDRTPIRAKNVVGVLEGSGPLAEETIVVGAHYDHLGRGGLGSLAFGSREIHNGADDNASGTATVIEMARRLGKRPDPLPRRVVFMAFSGEERGLLGSAHYVEHPLYPLDRTVAMVNFDMVGRLNKDRDLTVYGTGTSDRFDKLVDSLGTDLGLHVKVMAGTREQFSDSDHSSFARKDIPVLFFFTGIHPQYHRPSDDTDLINFDGMARIADLGELVLLDLARRPERPKFVGARGPARVATGPVRGGGASLGSIPDYGAEPPGGGLKLQGVREGSPAEKGGLQAGDVVIQFGDLKVTDIETYTAALASHKPGDTVTIVVRRDGQEKSLQVTLGGRARPRPGE